MNKWSYQEQDGTVVTMTEEEILQHYYPWWKEQMIKVGKADQINEQACIEDWVIVNWAVKVNG